ncbi:ABC transporter G family member 22 [Sesbania bispinosa]|nr:ABC transporter G family member 22 [Sesbania bispinosa]
MDHRTAAPPRLSQNAILPSASSLCYRAGIPVASSLFGGLGANLNLGRRSVEGGEISGQQSGRRSKMKGTRCLDEQPVVLRNENKGGFGSAIVMEAGELTTRHGIGHGDDEGRG